MIKIYIFLSVVFNLFGINCAFYIKINFGEEIKTDFHNRGVNRIIILKLILRLNIHVNILILFNFLNYNSILTNFIF